MPTLYIICGCNGAGKTTSSYTVLPEILQCTEFVNSDEIARGVDPYHPAQAAINAGRKMLMRIKELTRQGVNFAFETTLAVRSYVRLIEEIKEQGYQVVLIYFWLHSAELAMERVQGRVKAGGHDIPPAVIKRRYWMGIDNLFHLYMPLCDRWLLINNSEMPSTIIAEGSGTQEIHISNQEDFNTLKAIAKEHEKNS